MMTTKKITTFTIGTLAFVISALFGVHYLSPSAPAAHQPMHLQAGATQTYQRNSWQEKRYHKNNAASLFTNQNITEFIVASLVISAIIGVLVFIYHNGFNFSKIIAYYQSSATTDSIAALNSTTTSISQPRHHTVTTKQSSPPLDKDINPYSQYMQGGIEEHSHQRPSTLKVYGAGGAQSLTPSGRDRSKITSQSGHLDEIDESDYQTYTQDSIRPLHLQTTSDTAEQAIQYIGQHEEATKKTLSLLKGMLKNSTNKKGVTEEQHNIFKQLSLITGDPAEKKKESQSDNLKTWHELRNKTTLTFDIKNMRKYYKKFMPVLCSSDGECKNLLLFDKIAKIFPNAKEIVCQQVDYVDTLKKKDIHSSSIVNDDFITTLYTRLSNIKSDNHHSLQEVKISAFTHDISDEYCADTGNFNKLGWFLVKESKQIIFTKQPAKYIDLFRKKIEYMINGEPLNSKTQFSHSDMLIFHQLYSPELKASPLSNAQKDWVEKFTQKQKRLKIDMAYMYRYYSAFLALVKVESMPLKHEKLFNKLLKIFPRATILKCKNIDCTQWNKDGLRSTYSPKIVNKKLIKVLASNLNPKTPSYWAQLNTISITTAQYEIDDRLDLQVLKFADYLWYIRKENYEKSIKTKVNNQLTLIKEKKVKGGKDKILNTIVQQGIVPKISQVIGLKSKESNLTTGSALPILQKVNFSK